MKNRDRQIYRDALQRATSALEPPPCGFWNGGRPDVVPRPADWGEERWISLEAIDVRNAVQTRCKTSQKFFMELRYRYRQHGYNDYPVDVVRDTETDEFFLWDGRYRHEALRGLSDTILATVVPGNKLDASWLAFTLGNRIKRDRRKRGSIGWMPLTNDDKRFQMQEAFLHPYAQGMPIYKLRGYVGVSVRTAFESLRLLRKRDCVTWRGERLKDNFCIGHDIVVTVVEGAAW